ncbi:MAG: TetR/AcrR family transcriptional regulator [Deltaproteobacteria bacterium]|nr:TetR/AcrR family transcriptional regulator [Deltaproteobacteria bacterium]
MEKTTRKEQILASARRVFARCGYHETTVSHIIEESGIARGTFYLYFESKRDILNEILEEITKSVKSVIVRIDPAKDVFGQLRANIVKVLSIFQRDADVPKILLNGAVGLDKGFDNQLNLFYRDIASIIKDSLDLGVSMDIVRKLDTNLISYASLGVIKEIVYHQTVTGNLEVEADSVIDELLSFVLRGILK